MLISQVDGLPVRTPKDFRRPWPASPARCNSACYLMSRTRPVLFLPFRRRRRSRGRRDMFSRRLIRV